MKKNVKRLLLGVLVGAMSVFAVVASGCAAQDKLDTWYNQLTCEHAKVEKVVGKDATCTEDGYTEHEVCKDCDKELGKKVIKATGHENITVIEGYAATCTTTGKTDGEYCNDCKKTVVEQKTIYALGHKKTYARAEKATCTTDGHTAGWICGNDGCNVVYSGYELIPATGHDVDENGDCENCGKENAVIAFTDIEVGMDLSGYTVRLNRSIEEFNAFKESHTDISMVKFDFSAKYGDEEPFSTTFAVVDDLVAEIGLPMLADDGSYTSKTYSILDEENAGHYIGEFLSAGVVSNVNILDEELARYFDFVHIVDVETPATETDETTESVAASYTMNKRAVSVAHSSMLDEVKFSTVVNDNEWTRIF